jgi:hypothetical protein
VSVKNLRHEPTVGKRLMEENSPQLSTGANPLCGPFA